MGRYEQHRGGSQRAPLPAERPGEGGIWPSRITEGDDLNPAQSQWQLDAFQIPWQASCKAIRSAPSDTSIAAHVAAGNPPTTHRPGGRCRVFRAA